MGKVRIRIPALAAVLLLALGACAPGTSGPSGTSSAPATAPSGSAPATSTASPPSSAPPSSASPSAGSTTGASYSNLTVAVRETPGATAVTHVLVCNGTSPQDGSTVADPTGACAALEKYGPAAFAPPTVQNPKCPVGYASPRVATVTGTFHGSKINASFSQTDGCKIAVWNHLAPVFGSKAGEL